MHDAIPLAGRRTTIQVIFGVTVITFFTHGNNAVAAKCVEARAAQIATSLNPVVAVICTIIPELKFAPSITPSPQYD